MNNLGRGSEDKKNDKGRILTRETVGCVLVLFAAVSLVVLISRDVIFGGVGMAISSFLLGVFGYCSYVVLAALVYAGIVLITGKHIRAKGRTVALSVLVFVFLACLVHTVTSQVGGIAADLSYGEYLSACFAAGRNSFFATTCGGATAGLIVYPVIRMTTYVGGYIIFSLLLAGSAYLLYASRVVAMQEKRRKKREEERMIGAATADTAGAYTLGYADMAAQQPAQEYASQQGYDEYARPYAGEQPYDGGYPSADADPSRRLFSVGESFDMKSRREMRQDRRAETAARREEELYARRQEAPAYEDTRSILFSDAAADYKNNLIFDSDSYFNNPKRNETSRKQYTDSFHGESRSFYSEGHELSSARSAPPNMAEYAQTEIRTQPRAAAEPAPAEIRTRPRAAETPFIRTEAHRQGSPLPAPDPSAYSSMYRDETESNITYVNRPKKIVTDATRSGETPRASAASAAGTDFYRKDVDTAYSASSGDGLTSQRPVSAFKGVVQDASFDRDRMPPRAQQPAEEDAPARPETRVGFADRSSSEGRENAPAAAQEAPSSRAEESVRFMPQSDYEKEEEESSTLRPIAGDLESAVNLFDGEEEEEAGLSAVPEAAERLRAESEPQPEAAARREASAPAGPVAEVPKKKHIYARYDAPPITFLRDYTSLYSADEEEIENNKEIIVDTLYQLKIPSEVVSVTHGPTVTRYDIEIPGNIPTNRVLGCDKELAMRLHAKDGVNVQTNYENGSISIEVPNKQKATVGLKEVIRTESFTDAKPGSLMFGLGKDIEGRAICGDIVKMKHLLVAGSTGSGKSVCLNALIVSLLYKYSPEDLRIILVDPKQVEFNIYEKLPHLMINEIIFEPAKVITVLNWAITEMERRYGLFKAKTKSGTLVREIDEYNAHLEENEEKLPKIVMIIDELADLMQAAKKDIEDRIQRLTQKSRAAGIHLVLATQRPSTDVITGIIKSNLPTRIAFKVVQEVDSRTILDSSGAEKLLGYGDMLYKMDTMTFPYRVQGAYLSSQEVQDVVEYIKEHNEAYFDESVSDFINNNGGGGGEGGGDSDDSVEAVYIDALRYVVSIGQASISMIQRKCSVGYPKAGKIIEWMENMGYISAFEGAKARKVLMTQEEFESKYGDYGN